MNAIAKAVGLRWFERGKHGWEARFTWAEISGGFGLALGLCLFSEDRFSLHVRLGWPNIYLKLPFLSRWAWEPRDAMEQWGFLFFERAIHLHWGVRTKIVHMPWDWQHVRHEVFLEDGSKVAPTPSCYEAPYPDGRHVQSWPYRYVLRSGEVQERTATIYGEEREWRWRWFQWLPWPRKISRTISVTFSDEVGERAGSWKGGCIGCGYEWRRDETMFNSLCRMERERKF